MFKKKNDLLKGPVLSSLLLFTLPLFLSNIFQQLYNTVDTIIVGNYLGEMSLAAIGASLAIYQLLIGFGFGFGGGLSIVVARSFGTQDEALLKKSVAGSILLSLMVVVLIMVASSTLLKPLLIALRTPEEIFKLTYDYIHIITIFAIVTMAYNLTTGLLRAIGNSFIPLVFLVMASVLNIVLDIVFVILLDMGIEGAAYATVISQGVSACLSLGYIWKKEPILIPRRHHFKIKIELYKELLGQGLSMALMFSIVVFGTVVLQYAINNMGYLILAGHTTARRVTSLLMMPMSSIALSVSTFVSQNKGANQRDRIILGVRYAKGLSVAWGLIVILIVSAFSEGMIRGISGSSDVTVIATGSNYLKFNAPFFVIVGVLFVTRFTLQGLGEKIVPLISSLIELIMKVVFVIAVIPSLGYFGVIISEPIIWVIMTIQLLVSYYRNPYIRHEQYEGE